MQLDLFDDILAEVDEETSLVAFNGRIISHAIQELLNDFIPNYCYNSSTERYAGTLLSFVDISFDIIFRVYVQDFHAFNMELICYLSTIPQSTYIGFYVAQAKICAIEG